jgi:hypothetical protein
VVVVQVEALVVFPKPAVSEEYLGSACANPSFGSEVSKIHLQRLALQEQSSHCRPRASGPLLSIHP